MSYHEPCGRDAGGGETDETGWDKGLGLLERRRERRYPTHTGNASVVVMYEKSKMCTTLVDKVISQSAR